ncbi:hypothetical protein EYZ11_002954 [Aspergillus tanneri]|uniref:Uncharacterized protein n=1 Tax=Aspergillus tanneri TaxID=1220188 RepID=A0A4S3JPJ0_9EURO|nr:hypothetical protein EYZ11_002954 [Aspergillus tanneri]
MLARLMLYNIMAKPGYIEPLWKEIEAALVSFDCEWVFELMDKRPLDKRPRLESFTQETMRLQGPIACA